MAVRPIDDKASDTLVVVPGDGFWTGSSTLPHLHHIARHPWAPLGGAARDYGVGLAAFFPTRMIPMTRA